MTRQLLTNEIFNSQIQDDLENKSNVQEGEKATIYFCSYRVLNNPVDSENINRFDDEIQDQEEAQICNKFPFQACFFTLVRLLRYYLEIA